MAAFALIYGILTIIFTPDKDGCPEYLVIRMGTPIIPYNTIAFKVDFKVNTFRLRKPRVF